LQQWAALPGIATFEPLAKAVDMDPHGRVLGGVELGAFAEHRHRDFDLLGWARIARPFEQIVKQVDESCGTALPYQGRSKLRGPFG